MHLTKGRDWSSSYDVAPSVKISTSLSLNSRSLTSLVTHHLVASLDPYRDASPLLPFHAFLFHSSPSSSPSPRRPGKRGLHPHFNTTCSRIFNPTFHLFTGQIGASYLASLLHLPHFIHHILYQHRMKLDCLGWLSQDILRHLPHPRHTFDAN